MVHFSHLLNEYPELSEVFNRIGPLPANQPESLPVAEAICKIVVGQMLSGKAATSIYARLVTKASHNQLDGCWLLPTAELLDAGLSRRKARTIEEFAAAYKTAPEYFERWRALQHEELCREVSDFWGLSQWSADMLGIFYFANPDVFPVNDGSITRAIELATQRYGLSGFNPERAAPYRSFLARYLWAGLDSGYFQASK